MEVFNMDQDQLNSNLMPSYDSSSVHAPSSSSSSSSMSRCQQQARELCENCQQGLVAVDNSNESTRVISTQARCVCQTSTSSVGGVGGVTGPGTGTGSGSGRDVRPSSIFGNQSSSVRDNESRPSPSPTVMRLANSSSLFPSSPSSSSSHKTTNYHHHQQQQQQTATSFGSPSCPHLLNSDSDFEPVAPVGNGVGGGNLNRQEHYCQACGDLAASAEPSDNVPSSQEFSSYPSSPPSSSGPIPIPSSRTNRRPNQRHHHHRHHHHHHHHVSSSSSSSHDFTRDATTRSSSPPEPPTVFSSSCLSTSGWKFRDLSSGNTSGYSSSEPGRLHFFPQQSPKYFKQPSSSSSQDFAIKYPGIDKPSALDQWPRSAPRRAPSSSTTTTSSSPSKRFPADSPFPSPNPPKNDNGQQRSGFVNSWRGQVVVPKSGRGLGLSGRPGSARRREASHGSQWYSGGQQREDSPELHECRLPPEFLSQLHELEHQNEDLSADVVFCLEERGYAIHDILGKGISSTVRRVTEKQTGKEYAAKIIDISGENCETFVVEQTKKDTFREIRVLRMCGGHSNIIELHDVFETPTFIFLVFEICKQGELFDYLTSVVSLSEKKTRFFMRQLLEAVAFCHDKNIVHRDLKPENILLDDDLNIKVSDYGFATVVEPNEELSELCGTPGYLAPEVLAHSMYENVPGYGKEVDMWACGVIMFTLLCGAPPFWNRRQMIMLRAIMHADYTFNSPEWDDISDAPKNLIQKLLLVNPKERLTAKEALQHPFFHNQIQDQKKFNPRRKFRASVFCVMFYVRLNFYYKHPPPIPVNTVTSNPYSIKVMRKVIDSCAFGMYRHWVKRVDNQNRAALFEHTLREDWKNGLITNNSSWTNLQMH